MARHSVEPSKCFFHIFGTGGFVKIGALQMKLNKKNKLDRKEEM
jgi:hypothetical protein